MCHIYSRFAANGKNEMELGNVGSARSSQGFDNPVYDTPLPFEDSFTVTYDTSGDQVSSAPTSAHLYSGMSILITSIPGS